jgi:polyisoprenoid-binding protein YceI
MQERSNAVGMPAKGTWKLDPNHTVVGAVARHLVVTKVRGKFNVFSGAIHIGDSVEDSWAELEIDAASIDTGVPDRDGHLRSADFLDVEHHPKITYRSTRVDQTGPNTLRVIGDLTIRDLTNPVALDVTYEGAFADPWGGRRVAFSAIGEIERAAWQMTWNVGLETGGVLVSKTIQLEIEAQAVEQEEAIERAAAEEAKPVGDVAR